MLTQIFDFEKIEGLTITGRKRDRLSQAIEVPGKLPITIAMDIYVARQPIFDRNQKVIGYALLYRSGLTNSYDGADGTDASLAVIRDTFLVALPGRLTIAYGRNALRTLRNMDRRVPHSPSTKDYHRWALLQ